MRYFYRLDENNVIVESLDFSANDPSLLLAQGFVEHTESLSNNVGYTFDGTTLSAPVETPEVPNSVTPRQARLALLEMQLLDDVEAAIVSGPQEWQIEWEYATHIVRDSALVRGLGPALGLTSEDLDTLFTLAASK